MHKILIQIPCYNEEEVIENTLVEIRHQIKELNNIEILVIDDGSNDNTVKIAKKNNVHHIISHQRNLGLGVTFQTGLNFAKQNEFDFLINFDADNQYKAEYIKELIKTIKNENFDIIIGSRNFKNIPHFSYFKKKLQNLGSWVVRVISNQKVSDASSGFRIYSKKAIKEINCISKFSYTLDTIIQAGDRNLKIGEIFIETNKPTRNSRLFKSNSEFIFNQTKIILNCFAIYKPFIFFFYLALAPVTMGIFLYLRFLIFYFSGDGLGHVQSIIFGSTSLVLGFILIALGVIGELIKRNRKILEKLYGK